MRLLLQTGPQQDGPQAGLYVRSQCLPFIEAGCSSWAADAAQVPETTNGWTFFPGMDSPGGDICQVRYSSGGTAGGAKGLAGQSPGVRCRAGIRVFYKSWSRMAGVFWASSGTQLVTNHA